MLSHLALHLKQSKLSINNIWKNANVVLVPPTEAFRLLVRNFYYSSSFLKVSAHV